MGWIVAIDVNGDEVGLEAPEQDAPAHSIADVERAVRAFAEVRDELAAEG